MSEMKSEAIRTRDEFADAIRGLSDMDWLRLRKIAAWRGYGRNIEPDDLLQEAFRRALDGDRRCPVNVNIVSFLAQTMRSIAHGEMEKTADKPLLVPVAQHGATESSAVDPPDPAPGIEQELVDGEAYAALKASVLSALEDDATAQIIVEGMMEGMEGKELRELTDLDKVAYESKRRLIRRRIEKKFPQGWTS